MTKTRPGAVTSITQVNEGVEKARAEIKDILQRAGGPLTKAMIKDRLQADTKKHFDEARVFMLRNGDLYVHQRGLVEKQFVESLTIEERIAHIKWCLSLHEVSARQYLEDRDLLEQVPNMLKELMDRHLDDFPRWRNEVLRITDEALMMRNTLSELSAMYGLIEGGCRILLGHPPPNDSQIVCEHCGSPSVIFIGKNKDVVKCHECGGIS